jgi:hypothetical protein
VALTKKKAGPDPAQVYVCWQPHASAAHGLVAKGERRRGDDPVVRDYFDNFVVDGAPEAEWPDRLAVATEPVPVGTGLDVATLQRPERYVAPALVRLKRDVRVGWGVSREGRYVGEVAFGKGDLFEADAEIVRNARHLFEPEEKKR